MLLVGFWIRLDSYFLTGKAFSVVIILGSVGGRGITASAALEVSLCSVILTLGFQATSIPRSGPLSRPTYVAYT